VSVKMMAVKIAFQRAGFVYII